MNKMQRISLFFLFLFFFSIFAFGGPEEKAKRENQYPMVFVHGFLGWGPEELLGYKYWGGTALDIERYLKEQGFTVYIASVGPISSNHDRACELFYQIKGGRVDYGEAHSKQYKHRQFGKNHKGKYSQWDREHPIHLVGHSMGGQTCRVLVELLAQDYFGMGTDDSWVKSVTTISTPHNGTTLATLVNKLSGGFAEEFVSGFLGLAGSNWKVYNFDMDHWDIFPKPDESMHDFLKRIDDLLGESEDLSMHDLLPLGAKKLNQRVRTASNVYYFSYATEETYVLNPETGCEWARPSMNPIFWPYAYSMGHYKGNEVSPPSAWWKNDGIVNTISMKAPFDATIVAYDGNPRPGVWTYMGLVEKKDHGKIIGHFQDPVVTGTWLKKFYLDMALHLASLP